MPSRGGCPMLALVLAVAACSEIAAAATTVNLPQLASAGEKLDKKQAEGMETELLSSPSDIKTRAQLLGYYSLRPADESEKRSVHILWFIQNHPSDPFSGSNYCLIDAKAKEYDQAKALWQQQQSKDPDNLTVLQNAVNFLLPGDDASAEQLLRHAIELQPKMADWHERLAKLFELRESKSPDDAARYAAVAVQERQEACDLTHDAYYRFAILAEMPRDAFIARDTIRAKHLAQQLLGIADGYRDDPNYGLAIHQGNMVMGRVALHAGDAEAAISYLLEAGHCPPSPQLEAAGPDMSLARELLKRGEREVVHRYLESCLKLWTAGNSRLKAWIATLDAGGTPDFGPMAID